MAPLNEEQLHQIRDERKEQIMRLSKYFPEEVFSEPR